MPTPRPLAVTPSHAAPPARKPMVPARRVSLFEREIRFKLSTAAIEILFEVAEVLSEGQRHGSGYYGSTMITVDLGRASSQVREECDASSARRVAELVAHDGRARSRARDMAVAEAERRAGGKFSRIDVDIRARAAGSRVQIDLDVEGDLENST